MTTESGRQTRVSVWVVGALLTAALLLRFVGLGNEGLWCDEAYTALTIQLPVAEIISSLASSDDAPPLFYLLTKPIVAVAGDSEFALRALPAAAGVVAVLILLLYARRRRDPPAAWAAAPPSMNGARGVRGCP